MGELVGWLDPCLLWLSLCLSTCSSFLHILFLFPCWQEEGRPCLTSLRFFSFPTNRYHYYGTTSLALSMVVCSSLAQPQQRQHEFLLTTIKLLYAMFESHVFFIPFNSVLSLSTLCPLKVFLPLKVVLPSFFPIVFSSFFSLPSFLNQLLSPKMGPPPPDLPRDLAHTEKREREETQKGTGSRMQEKRRRRGEGWNTQNFFSLLRPSWSPEGLQDRVHRWSGMEPSPPKKRRLHASFSPCRGRMWWRICLNRQWIFLSLHFSSLLHTVVLFLPYVSSRRQPKGGDDGKRSFQSFFTLQAQQERHLPTTTTTFLFKQSRYWKK